MPSIQQLSTSVVNKIAAGEVIERPASVVKELVENSIDAQATRIDVVIEKGGRERIRVTDNGTGIPAEQLPLAVAAHATSKLREADDLFRIASLGFRGEALASMAEVSRLTLRSRPRSAESGAELEIVGGRAEPIHPVGSPTGTSVDVQRLFFNTPVRQKFLKTTQTEMGHIAEAFTRLALASPNIHFTLAHGRRILHDLAPVEDLRDRVASLFGQPLAEQLIPVESEDHGIRLSGYVANPMESRSNNRMQYLLLNGRFIRDRSLQHALGEAYRGLLISGRYPICFLHLHLPPDAVDVNVHPTKQEVRFQDAGQIYSQLLGTLRTRFLNSDLTARAVLPEGKGTPGAGPEACGDSVAAGGSADDRQGEIGSRPPGTPGLFDWDPGKERNPGMGGVRGSGGSMLPGTGHRTDHPARLPDFKPHDRSPAVGERVPIYRDAASAPGSVEGGLAAGRDAEPNAACPGDLPVEAAIVETGPSSQGPPIRALQIHDRYLVTETDEGLEIIDQHALHERILFQQLREKVRADTMESQRMLVPEPIDLAASEGAVVLENRELLSRLGIEIEPFGGETVLLTAYPAMLAHFDPADLLHGLVEQLVENLLASNRPPDQDDLLDDLLHTMACKAAVKYGDRLTSEEITALLARRHLVQDHHHCPHGRPTTLVFTRQQLDRQFKRS